MSNRNRCHALASFLIVAAVISFGGISCKRTRQFQHYDGKWWAATPADQQLGFIDGYIDYYPDGERRANRLFGPRSWYQKAVSAYYETHSADKSLLAGRVLRQVAKSASPDTLNSWGLRDGVAQPQAFDGQVWMNYSAKERMGFVEGYLNALMPQTSRSVSFPHNPEYYANAITRWYGQGTAENASADYRTRRIAEVLWSMRNAPKPTQ